MAAPHFDKAEEAIALAKKIGSTFQNMTFSDLRVCCGEQEWPIHKVIICQQSDWFLKACVDGFMEADSNTIRLQEDEAYNIHALLEYCYTLEYAIPDHMSAIPLTFHAGVFATAEKYLVSALQRLAVDRITQASASPDLDQDLPLAAALAYSNTTDPQKMLRKAMLNIVVANKETLLSEDSPHKNFTKVFNDTPSFAADVARAVVLGQQQPIDPGPTTASKATGKLYRCPANCRLPFCVTIPADALYTHVCPYAGRSFTMTGAEWAEKHVYT
ncbi:BTB POZ domain [Lecanosticta acicola]|uniref:BTB POZ domain n=1 Tax=Lecanosticta acicola TaxID=111012 RepID=A0AAI9E855_9PEZI|nr:BTB POZ domain [Lecanosticta acicola]